MFIKYPFYFHSVVKNQESFLGNALMKIKQQPVELRRICLSRAFIANTIIWEFYLKHRTILRKLFHLKCLKKCSMFDEIRPDSV